MHRIALLAAAAALAALPAAAQVVSPQTDTAAEALAQQSAAVAATSAMEVGAPGDLRGRVNPYGTVGRRVGAAKENATAYRGPYDFGQCPEGTLLTPFGTCAVSR